MPLRDKIILITGGTGSFGKMFTKIALKKYSPKIIRIFSRDELKQQEMQIEFQDPRLRFFLGDVRDIERLNRAIHGADIIIHAAALKQVPMCEYNPYEAVKTNILGAQNIIEASIDKKVKKILALSSDKAVNPINLYGATKLCAEKLFIQGNSYVGRRDTRFSCVRYGNVLGSRGSVIPRFMEQKKEGFLLITDERMTRFWITLNQAVEFVIKCIGLMKGGEVFVPKIPSMNIKDLAKAICPDCTLRVIGIRAGEKSHELLLIEDEARHSLEFKDYFIIEPEFPWWGKKIHKGGKRLLEGFVYKSDTNTEWLDKDDLMNLIHKEFI